MMYPLVKPVTVAAATEIESAAAIIIALDIPSGARVKTSATRDDASASTVPTLKSIPPVRITNVMPSEIMPISETCRKTSVIFPASKKIKPPRGECGLAIRAITTTRKSPNMLCNRLRIGRADTSEPADCAEPAWALDRFGDSCVIDFTYFLGNGL